jgi:hypothetical protein
MLDEAGFIKRYDKNDVLGLVGELPVQLEEPLEVKGELDASRIRNVVVAAMGGSALAAEFVLDWVGEKLPVPVQISRGYELPGYVGKETLVVASSYSGTTEETLEALAKIKGRGAQIALKWKIDLNEGARQLAFWNVVPELNHNEMSSWEHPRDPGLKVVELRSELEHKRVERRFEIMNQLLSNRFAPIELRAPSEGRLDQMLWMWLLGGYVSTYLGILNQSDPSELPLVTKLKERLS